MGRIAAACLLVAAFVRCGGGFPTAPAPPFRGKSLDGQTFSNDSLKGKVVLIQFWATWCGFCRRDQPAVDEIARRFKDRGLVVLAVSVREDRKTVLDYLSRSPRSVRIVLNEDTDLTERLEIRGFPMYLALNRDGAIASAREGAAGREGLEQLLAQAGL